MSVLLYLLFSFLQIFSTVQPDPPVGLNWALLNMSLTSTYYDIMLSWKPPESADVEIGWMTLQYEIQYRDASLDQWEVVNVQNNHVMKVQC